ncbi:MAG: nuclear transport factor 2 family protein [Deltaproteobacteria bacterium]|nr:nuclear transport factor 2 family protein [Deltaproteobacteria bacterium]
MSTAENKKLIEEAFVAWANGDGMAFFNLLAENASWTVIGNCPISGTYVGRQRLVEDALKPQRAKLAGPPTPTVMNLIAEGDTVVIQWVGKGTTKSGRPYNNSYCYVVQIENGRIIRGTAYLDTELVRSIW